MKKRNLMLGTALMLAVLLVAGGTFAWFTATADPVVNEFTAGTLKIEVHEEFDEEAAGNVNPGDCINKKVYIENTGSKRALIRVKAEIGFADPNLSMDVVEIEPGEGWFYDNGYYYYEDILEEGESTSPMIKDSKVCFKGCEMGNEYQGAEFTITINAEGIQATNGAPTDSGWDYDPLAGQ